MTDNATTTEENTTTAEEAVPALTNASAPERRRWLPFVLTAVVSAGAAVGATLLVVGGTSEPAGPERFDLRGTMTLTKNATRVNPYGEGACAGHKGYDDIVEGAQVTVSDPAGKVVGQGELLPAASYPSSGMCTFPFSVSVPSGLEFYQVEVTHRGKVTFPLAKASAGDVALSL